jgi:hypothetical protein
MTKGEILVLEASVKYMLQTIETQTNENEVISKLKTELEAMKRLLDS